MDEWLKACEIVKISKEKKKNIHKKIYAEENEEHEQKYLKRAKTAQETIKRKIGEAAIALYLVDFKKKNPIDKHGKFKNKFEKVDLNKLKLEAIDVDIKLPLKK